MSSSLGCGSTFIPENEEGGAPKVIEKVSQNSEGKVPEDPVTNLAMLARLHGLEESNLMYRIFEVGEEEGLMRAIDEMLDRLSFEDERVASEVPWKGDVLQVHPKVSLQPTEKEEVCFLFRGRRSFFWMNGIWVCKGEAWEEVWMDILPLWVGGY